MGQFFSSGKSLDPEQLRQQKVIRFDDLLEGALNLLKEWRTCFEGIKDEFADGWRNDTILHTRYFSKLQNMEQQLREINGIFSIKFGQGNFQISSKPGQSQEERFRRMAFEIERKGKEIEQLKREQMEMQRRIDDQKGATNDALNRLSEISSKKLCDNNPNVTDLSDSNRPTKVAENYNELYDKEWTDVFSALTEKHVQDTDAIHLLRNTLKDVYSWCNSNFDQLENGIEDVFKKVLTASDQDKVVTASSVPTSSAENIPITQDKEPNEEKVEAGSSEERPFWETDEAKQSVVDFVHSFRSELFEVFLKKCKTRYQQSNTKHGNDLLPFVERCAGICFYMTLQRPPLILYEQPVKDSKFNKEFFKPYTKTGPDVEFIVWPPLLLHKGGPILCKGVAQGIP